MASIKIRTKRDDNGTEIKLLLTHPMENGRNRDSEGQLIAAHFITQLQLKRNDTALITADLSGGIAKNPFFTFIAKGGSAGDKIEVSWQDNLGNGDSAVHWVE